MTIKDAVLLNVDIAGIGGAPNRQELADRVLWQLSDNKNGIIVNTVKRKSVIDKIKKMLDNCEISEWTSFQITLP